MTAKHTHYDKAGSAVPVASMVVPTERGTDAHTNLENQHEKYTFGPPSFLGGGDL